jgi:D-sedoheptulose 7-phosphate isomerase
VTDIKRIRDRLARTSEAFAKYAQERSEDVARAAAMIIECYRAGGKVLIFGNGGSAAEAQHVAAELVIRMLMNRDPLPAIALTTDTSIITSAANDFGYDLVFEKQVRALGKKGDVAWGLSTSGTSKNVNLALKAAAEIGMNRIGMSGRPGSEIGKLVDLCLWVDEDSTPVIQEIHLAASHLICELVESEMFGGSG